jgi:hypothetical protein
MWVDMGRGQWNWVGGVPLTPPSIESVLGIPAVAPVAVVPAPALTPGYAITPPSPLVQGGLGVPAVGESPTGNGAGGDEKDVGPLATVILLALGALAAVKMRGFRL